MSFQGFSILQATQITDLSGRVSINELALQQNLSTLAFIDTKDSEQDSRLLNAESGLQAQDVRLLAAEGTLAPLPGLVSANESAITAHGVRLDGTESRLDAVEPRVLALETDISGRVQAAIDDKVAQATFDLLATELRDADSALTTALATKVSAVTQSAVDEAQNSIIQQKADLATVLDIANSATTEITNLNTNLAIEESNRINEDNHKTHLTSYVSKISAVEEFIATFLSTYSITLPDGSTYAYNGVKQNIVALPLVAENPTGFTLDLTRGHLFFDLPRTMNELTRVELKLSNNMVIPYEHPVNGITTFPSKLSIRSNRVRLALPPFAANGVIQLTTIYSRYSATAGTGSVTISIGNAFSPENPTNIVYDPATGALTFDLPNTISQLGFFDINFNGVFYNFQKAHFTMSGVTVSIADVTAGGKLPTKPVSGEFFDINTRYDAFSGSSAAGFARFDVV